MVTGSYWTKLTQDGTPRTLERHCSPRDLHPPAWGPQSDHSPTTCWSQCPQQPDRRAGGARTPPLRPAPRPLPHAAWGAACQDQEGTGWDRRGQDGTRSGQPAATERSRASCQLSQVVRERSRAARGPENVTVTEGQSQTELGELREARRTVGAADLQPGSEPPHIPYRPQDTPVTGRPAHSTPRLRVGDTAHGTPRTARRARAPGVLGAPHGDATPVRAAQKSARFRRPARSRTLSP